MSETYIDIPAAGITLEALHDPGAGEAATVICHPHPLYGGDMRNNVVSTLQAAFRSSGTGTLRFNFRGVGCSGGSHEGGDPDAKDLLSVVGYLVDRGTTTLHLAGYSYGAWIALKAIREGFRPRSVILVSPPLDFLDFSELEPPAAPSLIVLGDRDTFCAAESLRNWLASAPVSHGPVVEIVPGCDHFYQGREKLLRDKVTGFMKAHLPS